MASRVQQGGPEGLGECENALHNLSLATDLPSTRLAIRSVAEKSWKFLCANNGKISCMMDTLRTLPVPNVDGNAVREWFGNVKRFKGIDLLVRIVTAGAPVEVGGQGDLPAALEYGNHSSVAQFEPQILEKIQEDLLLGRAFVFPREEAEHIPGLRVSPLTVAVSDTKARICHDLSNAAAGEG